MARFAIILACSLACTGEVSVSTPSGGDYDDTRGDALAAGDNRSTGDNTVPGDNSSTGDTMQSGDDFQGGDPTPAGDSRPCPLDQHLCPSGCVSDDEVATCGDRCTPCPTVTNGTPTCIEGACGFTCGGGFFPCLGECLPDAQAPCGVNMPANEWVMLTNGDMGPRGQAAMIFDATNGYYLLIGGSMGISAMPRPYDIQQLSLEDLRWLNHFPLDKIGVWTPEFGDSNAPNFPNERFSFADNEGNARPNWATYPGIPSYYQYAFNPTTRRFFMYLWNRTFSYDVDARVWTLHAPATDPAGGTSQPRLLWGAMAFDSVDNEVLLFGGANVLDDDGRPGSWIYEVNNDSWRQIGGTQPSARALSPLMTDPDRRQALLFGGDELDRLHSDTWVFDFASESWTEQNPTLAPSPRAGHNLLFLPTSRTTVLVGGYTYRTTTDYVASHSENLPWEIWRFDWDTPSWTLVKHFDAGETQPGIWRSRNYSYAHAVGADDILVIQSRNGWDMIDRESWALRIDASVSDAAGTTTYGVTAGTTTEREGPYHPDWYTTGWPAPDPAAFATLINNVPENVWTEIDVPNRPAHNHDWGTAAIDPTRQVIYRWSGGHSAHSGTDILEYDMVNNRFSLSFPSEIPLDFEYSNDQTPGEWSFDNNPWMTGHTYKTYAYSGAADSVVIYKNPYTYYYDPDLHDFELDPVLTDIGGNMYTNVLCEVPAGMVAWTPDGVFELDIFSKIWSPLPQSGADLPSLSPDRNVVVYEPGADRLLLFASTGSDGGQVFAYTFSNNTVSALNPTGQAFVAGAAGNFRREAVYLNTGHVVLGSGIDSGDGRPRTLVYNIGENRWYAYDFDSNSIQSDIYGVSLGLVSDSRGWIWAINSRSHMFLLKHNAASADRVGL